MRVKPTLFLLLALIAASPLLADPPAGSRSPLLIAEISSNGDIRFVLTVYQDGGASLAKKDGDAPGGELCTATIPAASLEGFENVMHQIGALHLQDGEPAPNVTRKTISYFEGPDFPGRTHGNTFVYFKAEGPYLDVARAINALYQQPFAGCI